MKINKVSTAVLEANFDWTLIRIDTDEGVIGYGEAFLGPAVAAVVREFGVLLVGEDPTHIDRLMRRLRASAAPSAPGLPFHAVLGLETALLDITGKRFRLPIWQLLGGKYRDFVRIYADCHAGDALESITPLLIPRTPAWMIAPQDQMAAGSAISVKHHGWDTASSDHLTPESYGKRATEMAERGFRMMKFDVDVPTPYETDEYDRDLNDLEIEHMASLVEGVRRAVGREVDIAIDCHWNYGVSAAIRLARALEPYKLAWLEDPVPPENIPAIGRVQNNTVTTIATGENHYYRIDFERLITEAGLRLLAPDVQKVGLWEGRKLADLADMHYVNLTFHNISSPIGTMAGVHLSAAVPNFTALEWHAASVPFFDLLIKGGGGPMIQDGKIAVPDAPGLGIELDLDEAWKYRRPTEPFFE
jgi:L-alanine-DL-glutamate epimerase-like enolase superfamily enzyme